MVTGEPRMIRAALLAIVVTILLIGSIAMFVGGVSEILQTLAKL